MSAVTLAAVAGAIGVVVTALGAYLAAARKLSGKIATSDAEQLWTEARSIREDYRGQLSDANKRVVALEARVATLEKANNDLIRENLELAKQVLEQRQRNVDLNDQLAEVYRELQRQKGERP